MYGLIYRALTTLAGPLVPVLLDRREARGKEDPARRGERLGQPSRPRPDGPLIWVHAASVGEAQAIQVLIHRLLQRDPAGSLLLTTGTVSSARLMAARLPTGAFHQYMPLDRVAYARRFLDHWRPDLVVWTESEIWPNLLGEVARRRIPAALVNARMSHASFDGWRRAPQLIGTLLETFQLVLPGNERDARRLSSLGVRRLGPVGNLKYSAAPLAADPASLTALRRAIDRRPVWLAASTHAGEEQACAEVHGELRGRGHGDLLTIIVPRHPGRGAEIAAALGRRGLSVARRSTGAVPDPATDIYLVDTLGELGLVLRLAPLAFIGGSLVPHGGHNPIEAVQLGCAVLLGPYTENFAEISDQLLAHGGAVRVADALGLARSVAGLLEDGEARARLVQAAEQVARRHRSVADAAMAALQPLLDRALPPAAPAPSADLRASA